MQRSTALVVVGKPADDPLPTRPRTRGECERGVGIRPCPWVSCRHHLRLDLEPSGTIKVGGVTLPIDAAPEEVEAFIEMASDFVLGYGDGCSLDIAARDGATLEEVGHALKVTRERTRQIETKGLKNLLRRTPKQKRDALRDGLAEVIRAKK